MQSNQPEGHSKMKVSGGHMSGVSGMRHRGFSSIHLGRGWQVEEGFGMGIGAGGVGRILAIRRAKIREVKSSADKNRSRVKFLTT